MLSPAERDDLRDQLAAVTTALRDWVTQAEARIARVAEVIEQRPTVQAHAESHQAAEAAEAAETEDAGYRWSAPAGSYVPAVSDCSGVDFEEGVIAEARRSGDVRAELARLTERVGEVRAARQAQLTAEHQQATDADRVGQLARWHAEDQAREDAAEQQALGRCSDGDAA